MAELDVKTGEIIGGLEVELIPDIYAYNQCQNRSSYKTGVLRHNSINSSTESKLLSGNVFDLKDRIQQDILKLVPENPGLFISVSKGLTNLHWNSSEMECFSKAIADVAKATEACLITSGLDAGISHFIGQSVANESITSCIGIPPIGSVSAINVTNRRPRKLDHMLEPSHHSFVFMTDMPSGPEYGVCREQIEQMIVSCSNNCAQRVLIVLGGGLGTLMEVKYALNAQVPVLLCMGSTGVADFLRVMMEDETPEESLETKFYDLFNLSKAKERHLKQKFDTFLEIARECLINKHLISIIYSTTTEKMQMQLETEIILAVMKAATLNDEGKRHMVAMAERLLKNNIALLVNSCNDLKGTSIKHEILAALYKQTGCVRTTFSDETVNDTDLKIPETTRVKRVLRTHLGDEVHIWDAFMHLLDISERNRFLSQNPFPKSCMEKAMQKLYVLSQVENLLCELLPDSYSPHLVLNERKSIAPGQLKFETLEKKHWQYDLTEDLSDEIKREDDETRFDFFICALLSEYLDSVTEFWRRDPEMTLHHELLAVKLLSSLGEMQYGEEDNEFLRESTKEFHNMTTDFLYACAERNKTLTENMILKGTDPYLQQAYRTKNYIFATHPTVKDCLNRRWLGYLTTKRGLQYKLLFLVSIFCPILISLRIIWDKDRLNEVVRDKVLSRKKKIGFISKLWYFYSAPVVKTMVAVILHIIFLMLFSYTVLIHDQYIFVIHETVLTFWVISFFVEELKQAQINYKSTGTVRTYFQNPWNVADIFCITAYFTGQYMRSISEMQSNVVLSVVLFVYFVRLLYNFTISETVGPQLVMIVKMFNDLLAFSVIMLVFMSGYAVVESSIMYPHSHANWDLIDKMMASAFWILYGENNLDQFELEEPDCSRNYSIFSNGTLPRCPSEIGIYVVPYFRGAYAFLMVILMLNLLIAQFNFTFTQIQEKADWYWSSLQLRLINEFYDKPLLPPPFTMLIIPVYFLTVICQICYLPALVVIRCCSKSDQTAGKKDGLEAFAELLVKCFWSSSIIYKEDETFEKETKQEWNQRYEAKLKHQNKGSGQTKYHQCFAAKENYEMISMSLKQMRSQISELTRMVNVAIPSNSRRQSKMVAFQNEETKEVDFALTDEELSDTLEMDQAENDRK